MKQSPELEDEKIRDAKRAVETATSENLVELCQKYLLLLDDYRNELYKFRGSPEINRVHHVFLPPQTVETLRKQIRAALEKTTRERNKIEALLKSFVSISGYEAVETFNRCGYKGFSDWELKAGGIRFGGGTEADQISVQDAVTAASQLRRDEFLAGQTKFAEQKI